MCMSVHMDSGAPKRKYQVKRGIQLPTRMDIHIQVNTCCRLLSDFYKYKSGHVGLCVMNALLRIARDPAAALNNEVEALHSLSDH